MINIPDIDEEHLRFIGVVNLLAECLQECNDQSVVRTALLVIQDLDLVHLTHEEDIMRANEYPELERHAAQHAQMRRQLIEIVSKMNSGAYSHDKFIHFIKNWLSFHLAKEDMDFARFVEGREVVVPPVELSVLFGDDVSIAVSPYDEAS